MIAQGKRDEVRAALSSRPQRILQPCKGGRRLREQSTFKSLDARARINREHAFPNSNDAPAGCPQDSSVASIPTLISFNLLLPRRCVSFRFEIPPAIMPVPEAPIHKHRQLRFWKHEIRFARKPRVPSPAAHTRGAHQPDQFQFRRCVVRAADARHQLRTGESPKRRPRVPAIAGPLTHADFPTPLGCACPPPSQTSAARHCQSSRTPPPCGRCRTCSRVGKSG